MSPPREEGRLCDSPALKGKSTVAVKDVFCGELDEAKTRNVSTYSDGLATYVGQHRSSTTHGQVLAYNYDRMVTKGIITGLFFLVLVSLGCGARSPISLWSCVWWQG